MNSPVFPFRLITIVAALAFAALPAPASVYIVDQAASGAADTNVGTEQKPFKTIQHAANLSKPGDVIFVMAGHYPERVKLKASGAEGLPITFGARPRRSAVVAGFDIPASFVRIEGFEITADK